MQNNPQNLTQALVIGGILAILGVGAFLALFVVMGNAGVENSQRLLIALCLPPVIIGIIMGLYALLFRKSV